MGIVVGPRINEYVAGVDLEVNVRVLDAGDEEIYSIDGTYTYEGVTLPAFLNEVYPALIGELEDSLGDAQLQYYRHTMGDL